MSPYHFDYLENNHTNPIAIKGCTKIIFPFFHAVHQICSVSEVRIGMLTSKILQWDTVDGRIGRAAQLLTEYSPHIRSRHWGDRDGREQTAEETKINFCGKYKVQAVSSYPVQLQAPPVEGKVHKGPRNKVAAMLKIIILDLCILRLVSLL